MTITASDLLNYPAGYLPYGRVKVHSARSSFAVSLAEAKAHLRIDSSYTTDDTYITTLTKLAQSIVEKESGILLTDLVMTYTADQFNNDPINLGFNGNTVTHIKYMDEDNVQQTLASSKYDVSNLGYPSANVLIYPAEGEDWPDTYETPDCIEIRFTAGLSQTYNIPDGLIQAILLIIGRYYEIRQDVVTGTIATAIPLAAQHLINQYREATIV